MHFSGIIYKTALTRHLAVHGCRDAGQGGGELEEDVVGGRAGAKLDVHQPQLPGVGVRVAHKTNDEGGPGAWKEEEKEEEEENT